MPTGAELNEPLLCKSKDILAFLSTAELSSFAKANRYKCSTDREKCEQPFLEGVENYVNELPAGAEAVSTLTRSLRLRFSQQETEEIIRGYTEQHLTVYQLADRHGCHRNTISKLLKANGVEVTIVRMDGSQVAEAKELYESGQTLVQIAGQLGVGKTTVSRALVAAGVGMRAAHRRAAAVC